MPELTWLRAVALVAFAGTYLGLAVGHLPGFRVDRTGMAIIGFWEYARVGVPLTVVTLALGWLILVLVPI